MAREPVIRRPADYNQLLTASLNTAGYFERREIDWQTRAAIFRAALDVELTQLRLAAEQYLTRIHWDQIESMANELEQRMLAARSAFVQEQLMDEFRDWRDRSRQVLQCRSFWS